MRRSAVRLILVLGILAAPLVADAQPPAKVPVSGCCARGYVPSLLEDVSLSSAGRIS